MSDLRSLYRIVIHPILSVAIPYLFILTIYFLTRAVFVPGAPVPVLFCVFLLFVAVEEVSIGNALVQERASSIARLREIFLIALILLIFMTMVPVKYQGPFWGSRTLLYIILSVFQWTVSFTIQNNFRRRESFLGVIRRKQGEELKESLRQSGTFTREINTFILFNRSLFVFFITVEVLYIILLHIMSIHIPGLVLLLAGLSMGASIIGIASTNMFLNDLFIYSSGINIHTSFQRRRIVGAAVWIIFILAGAALIASNSSLLPASVFSGLIAWLGGLIPEPKQLDPRLIPKETSVNQDEIIRRLRDLGEGGQTLDLSWLFLLIERIIIVAALAGIAFFLIAPLLRGEGLAFFKKYNPTRVFHRLLTGFISYMKRLWRDILEGFRSTGLRVNSEGQKIDKYGFIIPDDKPGILKRLERNTVIRLYVKVVQWGKRKGIVFKGHGPLEYSNLLAEKFPEIEGSLADVAWIFEEAVFSPHRVGEKKIRRYRADIKTILNYRSK